MPRSPLLLSVFTAFLVSSHATLISSQATAQTADRQVDFAHEIVPILRAHCTECHGGMEAKGGFSMNSRSLWLESGQVDLDSPAESQLLHLVNSADPDNQMPPQGLPRLSAEELKTLTRWIESGLAWEPGFTFSEPSYEPPTLPRTVSLPPASADLENPIDRIVNRHFSESGQTWPAPISDSMFLRRSFEDLIGLLPTPQQLEHFLADSASDKRTQQIDRLLEERQAYAEHWLTFYNDLLRNDYSGTGFITGGRKQISGWLYASLVENKPYDQFVRELISPVSSESQGFIDGIKWRGEVSAGQTIEIQFSQSVSQAFLGINLKCASCHDSFIDRWTLEDAYGLAAIYSEKPLELHRCDLPTGRNASPRWLFPEIGKINPKLPREERLEQLAQLMTHRNNGRFTRTIVNRLWHRMMGRGIVDPLDAMQTEPWNEDLLDFLGEHLVQHDYNLKATLRLITTSRIYQAQSEVLSPEKLVAEADPPFRGPRARRLSAEQFTDAVWQITGSAPDKIDAPILRGTMTQAEIDAAHISANWIWSANADGLHSASQPAGESVLFKREVRLDQEIDSAVVAVTCDNEFQLFVNGRLTLEGDNWTNLKDASLTRFLRQGENQIVVLARNAGNEPNPAGVFLQLNVRFADGRQTTLGTDDSWQTSAGTQPSIREGRLGKLPKTWQPAVIVPELEVWRTTITPQAKRVLATAVSVPPMVRASLLRNNAFMRTLGRPHREQIVSSRPNELTTLSAIDLANNEDFASSIAQGAQALLQRDWKSSEELLRYLFRFAFARDPTELETSILLESLETAQQDSQVDARAIEDLLWAVLMQPEFLYVR